MRFPSAVSWCVFEEYGILDLAVRVVKDLGIREVRTLFPGPIGNGPAAPNGSIVSPPRSRMPARASFRAFSIELKEKNLLLCGAD